MGNPKQKGKRVMLNLRPMCRAFRRPTECAKSILVDAAGERSYESLLGSGMWCDSFYRVVVERAGNLHNTDDWQS